MSDAEYAVFYILTVYGPHLMVALVVLVLALLVYLVHLRKRCKCPDCQWERLQKERRKRSRN